jgi:hypothetical protein
MSAPTERAAISRSGLGQARTLTVAAADRGLQYYSAAAGVDNVSMCFEQPQQSVAYCPEAPIRCSTMMPPVQLSRATAPGCPPPLAHQRAMRQAPRCSSQRHPERHAARVPMVGSLHARTGYGLHGHDCRWRAAGGTEREPLARLPLRS